MHVCMYVCMCVYVWLNFIVGRPQTLTWEVMTFSIVS